MRCQSSVSAVTGNSATEERRKAIFLRVQGIKKPCTSHDTREARSIVIEMLDFSFEKYLFARC